MIILTSLDLYLTLVFQWGNLIYKVDFVNEKPSTVIVLSNSERV